jgi:hypothetical protein
MLSKTDWLENALFLLVKIDLSNDEFGEVMNFFNYVTK